MAIATFCRVALDCPDPDPRSLAPFSAGVLDGEVKWSSEDWYDLYTPDGVRIAFQRAPGHQPPERPRAGHDSRQAHLDLDVPDMDRAQEVLALGATPLDLDDDGRDFRVIADPAGHPFCLCRVQP